MFKVLAIPIGGGVVRGRLRHHWLEKFMLLDPSLYAPLRQKPSDDPARRDFERAIGRGGQFETYATEADQFLAEAVDAFSPAQIVDSGPLLCLPDSGRERLKHLLHDAYLDAVPIAARVKEAELALGDLKLSIAHFQNTWFQEPPGDNQSVMSAFREAIEMAKALHETMGKLPAGIVMP